MSTETPIDTFVPIMTLFFFLCMWMLIAFTERLSPLRSIMPPIVLFSSGAITFIYASSIVYALENFAPLYFSNILGVTFSSGIVAMSFIAIAIKTFPLEKLQSIPTIEKVMEQIEVRTTSYDKKITIEGMKDAIPYRLGETFPTKRKLFQARQYHKGNLPLDEQKITIYICEPDDDPILITLDVVEDLSAELKKNISEFEPGRWIIKKQGKIYSSPEPSVQESLATV